VLRGGEKTLREGKVILCLEMHNAMMRARGAAPKELLEQLRALGYRSWQCMGKPVTAAEILAPEIARIVCRKG